MSRFDEGYELAWVGRASPGYRVITWAWSMSDVAAQIEERLAGWHLVSVELVTDLRSREPAHAQR